MLDFFQSLDEQWLLRINGAHTPMLDAVMWFLSQIWVWVPFYLLIVVVLAVKFRWRALPLVLLIFPLIVCSDQLASGLFKNYFHRLRPSHEPHLQLLLHYVNDYRGGTYGFVSSHALNVFALSFYLLFTAGRRIKGLLVVLFVWATAVTYSRVYLGVHYPSDVLVPFVLSVPLAFGFSKLYALILARYYNDNQLHPSKIS